MKKLETLPRDYRNLGFDASSEGPSAPPTDEKGDADVSWCSVPPPKYEEIAPHAAAGKSAPPLESDIRTLPCTPPSLSFVEIYEACVKYASGHCCYSPRFARQMKLTDIQNRCAFHYTLESFGEKRESACQKVPYKGGPIDGPSNGRPPDPWDMIVPPPQTFEGSKAEAIIPHTDSVEKCSKCSGGGKVTCYSCQAVGTVYCFSCMGRGRNSDGDFCFYCFGSGRRKCSTCSGSGKVICSKCKGYGELKSYKLLLVTWTNHLTEWVSHIHKLPSKRFKKATGETIVSESKAKLTPIHNAPDASVNAASERLLEAHHNSFPNELIIKQRHTLRAIPFTVSQYKWKEEEGEFYIFGTERKVYFEYYPTDCCCICC